MTLLPACRKKSLAALATAALLAQCACSVVVGNIKPVSERSENFGIADLSKENPKWVPLATEQHGKPAPSSAFPSEGEPVSTNGGIPDVVYQSNETASVVALTSECRPSYKNITHNLRELTTSFLQGTSEITRRDEEPATVAGVPALQTTVLGKLNHEDIMLRMVVLHKNSCIYDLTYVARPQLFEKETSEFSYFVNSLRLK